jgi:glucose-1-phosphate adenylyltransferase
VIKDSVIMPNVKIGKNVTIYRAIIGEGSVIKDGAIVGDPSAPDAPITLIGDHETVFSITSVQERAKLS